MSNQLQKKSDRRTYAEVRRPSQSSDFPAWSRGRKRAYLIVPGALLLTWVCHEPHVAWALGNQRVCLSSGAGSFSHSELASALPSRYANRSTRLTATIPPSQL
ncbi:hypothetical protein LY78DRAFT_615378 [Colletotrichum sublineola]|nr:hypothetical protein LY78DRAFT_615378 [Colletotrichum sublineola]